MPDREFQGEKTEQPTPRRLEEAIQRGQIPRSAEVQTVFVLMASLFALMFSGQETWHALSVAFTGTLGHLHDLPLSFNIMQHYLINSLLLLAKCAGPVVVAAMVGGLLAGGMQSRFQTASEVLSLKWERLNPMEGFHRLCSAQSAITTGIAIVKLTTIIALTYSQVQVVLADPIFYSSVSLGRVAAFMAETALGITARVILAMMVIAAVDYTYQFWRNNRNLMMTREEVKEENKSTEGNPQVRGRMRRRARGHSQRKMLQEVRKADVVITNPTRLAIALRYDRKAMKAPRVVAKGSRLNAQRIREVAQQFQVPMIENKPLARLLFKYGKVNADIPVQLYTAVAEILAWVYRVNRYRYYTEDNRAGGTA
jgi:flagellar biosynthesis protein FlhB